MNRGDAEPEQRAPNILDTTPENQAPTFPNLSQVWPVRVIRRGDVVRPFPPHARSLADLTLRWAGCASAFAITWPAAARPGC